MSYRPWLEESALRQMGGLPDDALDALVERMARICDDPFDRMLSMPVRGDNPAERMAELGDFGFTEFTVDEDAGLVRLYSRLARLTSPLEGIAIFHHATFKNQFGS